ncbi:Transcription elongation factor (TFIIS) family protein [Thalictrum thalictroides]|uniref:Transcription elongation factor (TFIIS) family protein n=1 Tax=Thalictrum thalictroides TaxID=46969 RepID=A0A7J6WX03_THATH|nr:Transcription elongation factor (TFIIS) family protein [Thalictrum thalictroides]
MINKIMLCDAENITYAWSWVIFKLVATAGVCEGSMGLEDFFTLTELKGGLLTIDRVDELVSRMQKEKESAVKNVDEAVRQWSTVSNTLAATKNMDILMHFIESGGLYFLDQWLQESQQYSSESSVEESMCELLGALENFPIDNETPVFSGIMITLKNLIGHKSLIIQERVKSLLDLLKQGTLNKLDCQNVEKDDGCHQDIKPLNATVTVASSSLEHSAAISTAGVDDDEDRRVIVLCENELQHPRSLVCSQSESIAVAEAPLSTEQIFSHTTVSKGDENVAFQSDAQGFSIMATPSQPSLHTVEESSVHPAARTSSAGTCHSPVTVESNGKVRREEVMELKDFSSESVETKSAEVEKEISHVSSSCGSDRVTLTDTNAQQSVMEPAVINYVDDKERELCVRKTLPTGVDSNTSTVVSNPSDVPVGFGPTKRSRSKMNLQTTDQNDGIYSNVSQDLFITGCRSRKEEDLETRFHGVAKDVKVAKGSEDSATTGDLSKLVTDMKSSDEIRKSRLDIELDFAEDDPLEVARLVAKEAERQVVDYREPLYSSSSKQNSGGRSVQPGSPDSVNGEQDHPMAELQNEMPAEENYNGGVISPKGEDHVINTKNMDEADLSQVTKAAQEPAYVKRAHGFDLNVGSYSQEMDQPRTLVSSITAATTPKSAVELHGAPTGCSESVAASAICPVSNLRVPNAENAFSVEGSSSLKHRHDFLDIDLNVAEGGYDGATDPFLAKIPLSSGLPSGESSVEVSSKRAKRLKLDLNQTVDNGDRSPSPVSSSSLKKHVMRNLDLNDNPSLHDSQIHLSDHGASSSQIRNDSAKLQVDGPCISILGTRVPISRGEIIPQTRSFLPNGPVPASSICASYAQSGGGMGPQFAVPYVAPSPVFGYNSLRVEPYMSLSSGIYGSAHMPYTVDPRETPMGQQIMGSSIALPPSHSRSPFPISMTTAPSGLNWIGPSQATVDLSSSLFTGEVENREGTSRQLFVPGQVNIMEEQIGSASHPMSSGMGVRRREPDNGYDPSYYGLYKMHPPWR